MRHVAPVLALATVLLASCGGGGPTSADSGQSGNRPAVTTLQASNMSYGRTATITVQGSGLDGALTLSSENACQNVTQVAGGSELTQNFTCRVATVGEVNFSVRSGSGALLASLRAEVPLPIVTLTTSRGAIQVELDVRRAPAAVDNFLAYVNNNSGAFYRNTIFHRVVAGEVVQGGGFDAPAATNQNQITAKTAVNPPIPLQSNNGLKNLRGTVGMAREAANPNSATSQFFFNLKDNPQFDYESEEKPGLAVFGRVIQGQSVVDEIGTVATRFDLRLNLANLPVENVTITAATQTR